MIWKEQHVAAAAVPKYIKFSLFCMYISSIPELTGFVADYVNISISDEKYRYYNLSSFIFIHLICRTYICMI